MFRELLMASYMNQMATGVGLTCDMGKDGRSEMKIGNGWVEHERPDGKKFYVNAETGKRTWTRPSDALPEQNFEKCSPFVQKMQYDGKYPVGVETVANDGYDCQSFLTRLYDINQQKWGEGEVPAAAIPADKIAAPEVSVSVPAVSAAADSVQAS